MKRLTTTQRTAIADVLRPSYGAEFLDDLVDALELVVADILAPKEPLPEAKVDGMCRDCARGNDCCDRCPLCCCDHPSHQPCAECDDEPPECPTCSWPVRETVGLVCQTCGTDYGAK